MAIRSALRCRLLVTPAKGRRRVTGRASSCSAKAARGCSMGDGGASVLAAGGGTAGEEISEHWPSPAMDANFSARLPARLQVLALGFAHSILLCLSQQS